MSWKLHAEALAAVAAPDCPVPVGGAARLVWLMLTWIADDDGLAWAKRAALADLCGICERKLMGGNSHLVELERAGLIETAVGGQGRVSSWRVLIPDHCGPDSLQRMQMHAAPDAGPNLHDMQIEAAGCAGSDTPNLQGMQDKPATDAGALLQGVQECSCRPRRSDLQGMQNKPAGRAEVVDRTHASLPDLPVATSDARDDLPEGATTATAATSLSLGGQPGAGAAPPYAGRHCATPKVGHPDWVDWLTPADCGVKPETGHFDAICRNLPTVHAVELFKLRLAGAVDAAHRDGRRVSWEDRVDLSRLVMVQAGRDRRRDLGLPSDDGPKHDLPDARDVLAAEAARLQLGQQQRAAKYALDHPDWKAARV